MWRNVHGNGEAPEEAQKQFKSKHGSLKAVEAGENVRHIGRVEFALKNGDVLSIGVDCEKEGGGKLFRSIVNAMKGTLGFNL